MNHLVKSTAIVSTLALLSVAAAGSAAAAQKNRQGACTDPADCPGQQMQEQDESGEGYSRQRRKIEENGGEDAVTDEQIPRKRRIQEAVEDGQGQEEPVKRKRQAKSDWDFESGKHERRRKRDNRFRYEFDGYWYPEQYWLGFGYPARYGISCGEGRELLRERGFRRVRTVECQGRTFTYVGFRYGDTFRVLVNSRTGRIVGLRNI